jgi:hypothetical protein
MEETMRVVCGETVVWCMPRWKTRASMRPAKVVHHTEEHVQPFTCPFAVVSVERVFHYDVTASGVSQAAAQAAE